MVDPPRPPAPDVTEVSASPFDGVTPASAFQLQDHVDTPVLLVDRRPPTRPAEPLPDDVEILSVSTTPPTPPPPAPAETIAHPVANAPASGHELVASWASADKHRRALPRPAKLALAAIAGVVVLVLVAGRCGSSASRAAEESHMLYSELVVSEESLRKRREATPDDFRPHAREEQAPAPALDLEPAVEPALELDLDERRRRRRDNPEDVRYRQRRPPANAAAIPPAARPASEVEDIVVMGGAAQVSEDTRVVRITAGTRLRASLRDPIALPAQRVAVARVRHRRLPAGSLLLGRATSDGSGQVVLRFRSLVLPDGSEHAIHAEAVLGGAVAPGGANDEESIAADVGENTAGRVARGVLGTGVVGDTVDDVRRARHRSRVHATRRTVRVSVAKGAQFSLVLDRGLELRGL